MDQGHFLNLLREMLEIHASRLETALDTHASRLEAIAPDKVEVPAGAIVERWVGRHLRPPSLVARLAPMSGARTVTRFRSCEDLPGRRGLLNEVTRLSVQVEGGALILEFVTVSSRKGRKMRHQLRLSGEDAIKVFESIGSDGDEPPRRLIRHLIEKSPRRTE